MTKTTTVVVFLTLLSVPLLAQDEADLAKQTQNPVSDLISVPFQSNFNFGVGPDDDLLYNLNIQPVYPMNLNERWNWIHRTIIPILDVPEPVNESGLGDIQYQGFLSPAKPGKVIWGVGPVVSFPSASDEMLGAEKWSAGPGVVALTMRGPWVVGALVNNIWSFSGEDDRGDVNQGLLQYFVNYNLPGGAYFTSAPVITANWEADSDDRWTVPVGIGVGKVFTIGKQPVNTSLHFYYNVEKPDFGADWTLRFQVQLLFPKR